MSQSGRYQLVSYVQSSSNPSKQYAIKWDGSRLTCPCRGWIMNARGDRGCRHTDAVNEQLRVARMTAPQAVAMLAANPTYGDLQGAALAAQADPITLEVNAICRRFNLTGSAYAVLRADIEGAIRKFASTTTRPLAPAGRPDWLGGGRAIILRD